MLCIEDGQFRVRGMFDAEKRVPDTDSFRIESEDGEMLLSQRQDVTLTACSPTAVSGNASSLVREYDATLVVLLESPHKDEFELSGGSLVPSVPANGSTGSALASRLIDVIRSALRLEAQIVGCLPVRVVLCNPVQFQASLYAVHHARLPKKCRGFLKHKVWCAFWSEEAIRRDFLMRVEHANPNWILNACVEEGHLNWEVSSFLANNIVDVELYRTVHPSSRWQHPSWIPWCKRVMR